MDPNQQPTPTDQPETIQPDSAVPRVQPSEAELTTQVDTMLATSSTGAAPAPPAPAEPIVSAEPAEPVPPAAPKRNLKKVILIVIVVLVVLAGLGAAAYAEIIVPNKPENVLKSALENSLQADQFSYKGQLDMTSDGSAAKAEFSGAQDNTKQASDITLNATYSGVTLPVEIRRVDKNIYLKAGDLSPIATIVGAYSPATASLAKTVSQQLSNKWISVDSTLLKTAGASCFNDVNFSLTDADVKLLEDQYSQHPFATITTTSGDTVDGLATTKYDISIDDDAAVVYGKGLNSLSLAKALQACSKNSSKTADTAKGDHDKTPLTIWVDKSSKHIVKLATKSTAQDAKKGTTGTASVTFKYQSVSINAPTDSTPAVAVLASLEQSLGMGSGSGADLTQLLSGLGQ